MAAIESVPPLFIKVSDLRNATISEINMCKAIIRIINPSKLDGVQKIRNIWRIYLKDKTTRIELFLKESLVIEGKHVKLYDQNPNLLYAERNIDKKLDKLTFKHLPFSLSHDEVVKMLTDNNITPASDVKFTRVREVTGELTGYKNGDRFVFVEAFDPPLPKKQTVANFKCLVIHHGKENPCISCGVLGHKVGDEMCTAKPSGPIYPFTTHQHPLSNQFPCQIDVNGRSFPSVDHAYLWRMASEFGKLELAEDIAAAKHAGVARRLAAQIADEEERRKWSEENFDVMEELLEVKLEHCEQFRQSLLDNRDSVLAEASRDKFWGTGLSRYVTEHTAQEFWPGKNFLGAMLMDLTSQCLSAAGEAPADVPPVPVSVPQSEPYTQSAVLAENASGSAEMPSSTPASSVTGSVVTEAVMSPQRASINRSRPNHKTPAVQRAHTALSTPSIRAFFDPKRKEKRKVLASSPDQEQNGTEKLLRSDSGVS